MFRKLNEWKTATKVVAGFGVMLTILGALGATGYLMFGRVQSNVTELSDHSLGAVKNAAGIERATFQAIVAEKNYVLYKKDEFDQATKKSLGDLAASLDAVDNVAQKFNDTELAKKSKDVRALATQFGKQFDESVAAINANEVASQQMDENGHVAQAQADAYIAAKKAEYLEAKDALAIANRVTTLVWELRYHRLSVFAQKSDEALTAAAADAENLAKLCNQLEKMHPDRQEQGQIENARKSAGSYLEMTTAIRESQKRGEKEAALVAANNKTADVGAALVEAVDNYLAAKNAKVDKSGAVLVHCRRRCRTNGASSPPDAGLHDKPESAGVGKIHGTHGQYPEILRRLAESLVERRRSAAN